MMETQTYTRRENARRAAIAAGIPKELIKITVHKTPHEVRFGYAATEQPVQPLKVAASTATATATQKRPTVKHSAPKPQEQNGVKRPAAGGLCAAVWEYLDTNPASTAKHVREAAAANGWNTNNALCELYTWRKFNGKNRTNKKG
jgi:hypothetical protein